MSEKEYNIFIKIGDFDGFHLKVSESEESFYRSIVANINKYYNQLTFGRNSVSPEVALSKVTLMFAELYYRRMKQQNSERTLLEQFEARIDGLLKGTD
ncbi:MAG: hypothetical protein K2F99_01315 [Muribaculaceae bacterium]|nr:cell division protein ZapA [Bacteroidales bacterium]MDE6040193.1 hypothetical protein [Muribaculaceae bacterium]